MFSSTRKLLITFAGDRSFSSKRSCSKASICPVTVRIFRLLQRTVSKFKVHSSDVILMQRPLEENEWGHHVMFHLTQPEPTSVNEILRLFSKWNEDMDQWYGAVPKNEVEKLPSRTSCWTTPKELREAIRIAFRIQYNTDSATQTKWAIRALQVIQGQREMWSLSSVATTQQVRITATSKFIGSTNPSSYFPPAIMPDVLRSKYRFAYRIRIENLSDQHVQLLGRYWHIKEEEELQYEDAIESPIIVDAPKTGAVGQLPVLRPNQVFEYTSGADLRTSRGRVQGHFYMAVVPDDAVCLNSGDDVDSSLESKKFKADVAPFPLVAV